MDKIGGFDPGLGIQGLPDGKAEIGRANLPGAARLLPDSLPDSGSALVHGRITGSALQERFASYTALDLRHRELLSPDVFFESLELAAAGFAKQAQGEQISEETTAAARTLTEALSDRALCEMLRNLVIKV